MAGIVSGFAAALLCSRPVDGPRAQRSRRLISARPSGSIEEPQGEQWEPM